MDKYDVNKHENFENYLQQQTTESLIVEGFLENLSDIYESHDIESTTDLSILRESIDGSKRNDDKLQSANVELSDEDLVDSPQQPLDPNVKYCEIVHILDSYCRITCSNINIINLSTVLNEIIHTELVVRSNQ